jgi:acetylornithine deacetylase/succinyl-diaminopimelate desuccinylase-like protein
MATTAVDYVKDSANQKRFLEELKTLLRIPSVSTLPEHKGDVRKAAQFLADDLKRAGMENVSLKRRGTRWCTQIGSMRPVSLRS